MNGASKASPAFQRSANSRSGLPSAEAPAAARIASASSCENVLAPPVTVAAAGTCASSAARRAENSGFGKSVMSRHAAKRLLTSPSSIAARSTT